jgi:hypothetical protein
MPRVDKSLLTFGERPRVRDEKYRQSARGRPCMACGRQDDTVVLAHINIAGNFGRGLKAGDNESVFLCGLCHADLDADTARATWLVRNVLLPLRREAYRDWLSGQPARRRA